MIDTVAGGSDDDDRGRHGGSSRRLDTSTPLHSERRGRRKPREDKAVNESRTSKVSAVASKHDTEVAK
jgi:hypothetical protein